MKKLLALSMALFCAGAVRAAIHTETIEYKQGDTTLAGLMAYDVSIKGPRSGVLIVHQWKGLTDYEQKRAEMLAKLGYVAFCVDIYGKGVRPKTPQEAGAEAGKYKRNRPLLRERVNAGLDSPTPADGKNIKCKVLACHGADDPFVLAKDLEAFESEMRDAGVDWRLNKYGGAVHSFTDWGMDGSMKGAKYDEKADKRSWEDMKGFFAECFR